MSDGDKKVLGNLSAMAKRLKELAADCADKEEAFKKAKEEYERYRTVDLPNAMLQAGVSLVETADGDRIEIRNKYYCNPNKNDEDRKKIGEWLSKWGASHLIKRTAVVSDIERLSEAGIPHVEKWDMNTNTLKAWIKDQLGVNGGAALFSTSDIPECVHFNQIDEAEITA
jgi:hypothetical protein